MGQAQINVRIRACSRTSIARTKQDALTHNVRGKELTGQNYFRHFPPSLPSFVFMHAFNHSTSAHVKKLCILVQTCDF